MSRLPAALMLLAEPLPPKSFTFKSTLRPACRVTAPLVVLMSVVEVINMSRPALALKAGCETASPVVVMLISPLSSKSLLVPLAFRTTAPAMLPSVPKVIVPLLVRATPVPALNALVSRLAAAPTVMLPALALREVSTTLPPEALTTALPVLATIAPPKAEMLPAAARFSAAPLKPTLLPSERKMLPPAVRPTLPTAVKALAEPLPPKSLTFRSMAPAALSKIAPEVLANRLVVLARLMLPPPLTLIAATLPARPVLVVVRLPLRLMSNPPAVCNRAIPLRAKAPILK